MTENKEHSINGKKGENAQKLLKTHIKSVNNAQKTKNKFVFIYIVKCTEKRTKILDKNAHVHW